MGSKKLKKTGHNAKGKSKKDRTPSLKEKLNRGSKIVRVNDLQWKKVDIPDNLDDYEGLYGLEELDGVDVKMVDGNPTFIMKDTGDVNTKSVEEVKEDLEEAEDVNMDEEFKGFDDEPVFETSAAKEDISQGSEISNGKVDTSDDEKLLGVGFHNFDVTLPDDNIVLPDWNKCEDLTLSPYIVHGLNDLGFTKPTPIQEKAIPLAIQGKDVVGKATTGSGKTLAYGIPILEVYLSNLDKIKHNLKEKKVNPPTGVIFTPTRELAHQVVGHLNGISKFSPLSTRGIVSITGGLSIQKQERLLSQGPAIIVATPGRFLELLRKDNAIIEQLSQTAMVVLDEADRLLQEGHFDELKTILELLKVNRPKSASISWRWQTLVFSATFSRDLFGKLDKFKKSKGKVDTGLLHNDEIITLLNKQLTFRDTKPALIDANPDVIVSGMVSEALVECGPLERDLYLYYFLLMYTGATLVFTNSIDSVKRLVPFLNSLSIPTFSIHSSMMQKQRLRSLERFNESIKTNQRSVLVASDVAARGLDIPNIDHVAHYHLPRTADVYIHRSGRTARAGKEGVSVMFCSPQEASGPLKKLRKLVAGSSEKHSGFNMHGDVKLLPIEMDIVSQLKPRVKIASQLAESTLSTTSTKKEDSWVKEAAEELGIDNLSDLEEFSDDILKKKQKRKENKMLTKAEMKSLRAELRNLLSHPVKNNSRRSYITGGLQNIAHVLVTHNKHEDILGHEKVNALEQLKTKKAKKGHQSLKKVSKIVKG